MKEKLGAMNRTIVVSQQTILSNLIEAEKEREVKKKNLRNSSQTLSILVAILKFLFTHLFLVVLDLCWCTRTFSSCGCFKQGRPAWWLRR